MGTIIEGITVTKLKIIASVPGDVMHAMKTGEPGFSGFGEAYFSTIKKGVVKGWKRHSAMTLNIVVPSGIIRFVIYDDRQHSSTKNNYFEITLSPTNYHRLTVQPGLWMAFEGIDEGLNMLLNIGSIKHDPQEAENCPVESGKIKYPRIQNAF